MNNKSLITQLTHNVKSFECGPDSKLRIHNLFMLLQELAYLSAENLGFGYTNLKSKNMAWVLSNLKVQFLKFPQWTDSISIETWPSGFNRLHGFRDFSVKNNQGESLMNSTSEWLAIDVESRRPININDFEIELPDYGERSLDEKLRRLNPKRLGVGKKIFELVVPFSAIDENGHVNNAEYIKWSLDGMRKAGINVSAISSLQVSFISELFEKERCKIYFQQDEDSFKHIWGINAANEEFIFAIKIECL